MSIIPIQNFDNQSVCQFNEFRNSELWQVRDDIFISELRRAALVMLVKNAEDIIGINLRHHYSLGFRRFFILDNNSNDKTAEIIKTFKQEYKEADVFYCTDYLEGHYQQTKTEAIARFSEFYLREEEKPSWIFPIDSDEFITCCTKNTDKAIEGFTNYLINAQNHVLLFLWANAALFSKERNEITYFGQTLSETDFQVCQRMDGCWTKAAYRTGYNMSPTMGNHFVNAYEGGENGLRSMLDIGFCLLHFQFRSIEQFRLKIIDGMNGLNRTCYTPDVGNHWRFYYQEYQQYGDDALKTYLDQYIQKCL